MEAIFSTAYLAPIEYYIEYIKTNKPILELSENYQKQSYRNRCCIMSANNILNLTIPIQKNKKSNKKIDATRVYNNENWQNLHWKSIESAYRTSPYFEFYENKQNFLTEKVLGQNANDLHPKRILSQKKSLGKNTNHLPPKITKHFLGQNTNDVRHKKIRGIFFWQKYK